MRTWRTDSFSIPEWHTTWRVEPNLIFILPSDSFHHSQLHLCRTRSRPFISFFIITAIIHQASPLFHDFKIYKAVNGRYWHFLFFPTTRPSGCGIFIDWRSISNDISFIIRFLNVNNGEILASSAYHSSSVHSVSYLEGLKPFLSIYTPCVHFMTWLFKMQNQTKRWQRGKYWIKLYGATGHS